LKADAAEAKQSAANFGLRSGQSRAAIRLHATYYREVRGCGSIAEAGVDAAISTGAPW